MARNKVPERIRMLRTEARMNQTQLAARVSVTRQTISNYESGKRECSIDLLIALADCFQVSVDYLVGRTDER